MAETTDTTGDNAGSVNIIKPSFASRLIKQAGFNQRYFWISFWFILFYLIMLIPIFCGNAARMIQFAPSFLWSCACSMSGVLLGFIFGVPTIITQGPATPTSNQAVQSTATAQKIVQANTNLTQISDWLTKILIGAGLVELTKIPGHIEIIAKKMSRGLAITQNANDIHYAAVFAGGIIVAFLTYGFIVGYLIMRTVLTEVFSSEATI